MPERWGFQDRPVQILLFKALFSLSGHGPAAYYLFKAFLVALLAVALAFFARGAGLGARAGLLAGAVVAAASPTFASALWVSDFELLAQLLTVAFLGAFLAFDRIDPSRLPAWTARFWAWQAGLFALALLAHRTKGSAKLLPGILLCYLLLFRRRALRRCLPLVAALGLSVVPVFHLLEDPVPPFAPFSPDRSEGWKWKPANLETLWMLTLGNTDPLTGTAEMPVASSLGSVLCPVLLVGALASLLAVGPGALPDSSSDKGRALRLTALWAAAAVAAVAAFAAFPRLPAGFMARYVVVGLVPLSLLLGALFDRASRRLPFAGAAVACAALILSFAAQNLPVIRFARESIGQTIVAYDRAREDISRSLERADVLLSGFTYGYHRQRRDTNRYFTGTYSPPPGGPERPFFVLVRADQDTAEISHLPAVRTIERSIEVPEGPAAGYRVGIRPVRTYHGLTRSYYDRHLYGSGRSILGLLYEVRFEPVSAANRGAASGKESPI